MALASTHEAVAEIRAGRMVIVVDDEDRENEGDLTMAAELVSPAAVNFMLKYARGLVCVPLTAARLARLGLPLMPRANTSPDEAAFAASVDVRRGATSGVSALDRAATIRALADSGYGPADFASPGHVFPLCARDAGVLERRGQTEAAVDLARLAGLTPAGVVCEILDDDGTMMRRPRLDFFAATHGLRIFAVHELAAHRALTRALAARSRKMVRSYRSR